MGETREKDDGEGMSGTREELTGVPGLERLVVVERTGSTNDDLRSALTGVDGRLDLRAAAAWPHISALWARRQDAGRGRAGRRWITPPGSALTVSFVLRPLVPAAALAWLPLLAGLAARDVVDAILISARAPWRARTKWPNDVVLVPNERAGEGIAGTPWLVSQLLARPTHAFAVVLLAHFAHRTQPSGLSSLIVRVH